MAREATEIQNIQIADGPVCHGWSIPVYMIFPRLFTCPTVSTRNFKVDFEVNLGEHPARALLSSTARALLSWTLGDPALAALPLLP